MATLARTVIQRHPETGRVHTLPAGSEVPDWATVTNPAALVSDDAEGEPGDGGAPDEDDTTDELQDILGEPADDLEDLNVEELKDLLREADLPVSGTKDELIERLREEA